MCRCCVRSKSRKCVANGGCSRYGRKEEWESLEAVVVYGRIKWSHEIRGNRGVGEWLEQTDALRHVDAIRARVVHHPLASDLLPSTREMHKMGLILFSAHSEGLKFIVRYSSECSMQSLFLCVIIIPTDPLDLDKTPGFSEYINPNSICQRPLKCSN